jgi:multicomponent Na+:H+ antiporter subunit E
VTVQSLIWNILLALAWAALTGGFTPQNLALGFGLGFLILVTMRGTIGSPVYARKALQVLDLLLFFSIELVKANLRVAYDVLTPGYQLRPAVVAVPLDARTDLEITLLANLITLTPGTLSLDVSKDRGELYVHAMYLDDVETMRRQIKQGFERRVLEVLR